MAHYAFLDENNVVTEVITGRHENEVVDGISDWEAWYGDFRGQRCLRTSYNTFEGQHNNAGIPFRGNYAGIGYTYDETLDAFIPPKPFESWVLDEDKYRWVSPASYPEDGEYYVWDEEAGAWTAVE
jgi:hypothetical protein